MSAGRVPSCEHTEHAVRGDGRYGRSFPRGGPDAGIWERCEAGRGLSKASCEPGCIMPPHNGPCVTQEQRDA